MKNIAKLVIQTIKVFILFAVCTILFYYGMIWVSQEYQNYQKYNEPDGTAVKVMQQSAGRTDSGLSRLMLFYLNGE